MKFSNSVAILAACFAFLQMACHAQGQEALQPEGLIQLDPPGQREFILDKANLINPEDAAKIRQLADKLLTDKAAPLVIVTIHSTLGTAN